ncbi:MAG: cell division protein ZapA [Reinekea sp.]|jgi:cell division protein ZapA
MTEPKTLTVQILDREYLVACPPGQEVKLREAAHTLNNKMQEIRDTGKVFGIERIAVMAALNLTHELLKSKPENENDRSVIVRLVDKLNVVLPNTDMDTPLSFDLGDPL